MKFWEFSKLNHFYVSLNVSLSSKLQEKPFDSKWFQNFFSVFFFFNFLTLSLPEFILRQSQFLYPLFTFSTFCHLLNCIEFQGLILADDSWNNHLFIRKKSILQFVPCNGKVDSKPSDVCIVSVFNTHWNVLLSRQLH